MGNWIALEHSARNNALKADEAHELEKDNEEGFAGYGSFGCIGHRSRSASAADLAARPVYTKAPPMMTAIYDWSGFYIGINGGWAQDHDRRSDPVFGLFGDYDSNGGTVGGQVSYRWQTGPVVFGLEAQGNWADLSGNTTNLLIPGTSIRSKLDAFGLFTGQIGYAWNNVLLYAKGGAAVTDRNYDFFAPGVVSSTGYDTRWSPTTRASLLGVVTGDCAGSATSFPVPAEDLRFVPSGCAYAHRHCGH